MLKVGINLTWLRPGEVGGSEEYLTRLLAGLVNQNSIEPTLYVLEPFVLAYPQLATAFRTVEAPVSGANRFRRVASEQSWLATRMARDGVDVAFHAGGTMPVRPGFNPALLVHDVQYLTYPRNFSRVKLAYLKAQIPRGVSQANMVMAPTRYVIDRLSGAFGLDPNRAAVVPHPIDAPPTQAVPFDVDRPVILYPAITYPHKNHVTLVRALAVMRNEATLVLTGGSASSENAITAEVERFGLGDRVKRLGRVPVAELERWWATASVMACPSLYEGFGAPLVEAMVRKVPVAASRAAAIPEVVGDAAVLVDPLDVGAWAAALDRIIDGQGTELAERGQVRAKAFTTEAVTPQLVQALVACRNR